MIPPIKLPASALLIEQNKKITLYPSSSFDDHIRYTYQGQPGPGIPLTSNTPVLFDDFPNLPLKLSNRYHWIQA